MCLVPPFRRAAAGGAPPAIPTVWRDKKVLAAQARPRRSRPLAPPPAKLDLNEVRNVAIESTMARLLEIVLNGRPRVDAAPDNLLLLVYLREIVGLTGTKTGCDGGECGACTVLVDDQPRLSCLTLAAGVNRQRVA